MTLFGLPFWHFVFAALGATGVVWTVAELWEAVQAQRWPSVEGEVTSVRLLRRVDSDGEVKFDRSVRYHFEVGGRSYEHSRVRFGETVRRDGDGGFVAVTPEQVGVEGRSASALARAAVGDDTLYEEGQRVRVYYDPADPRDSILDRRLHVDALKAGAAALVALGYGLWPLVRPG